MGEFVAMSVLTVLFWLGISGVEPLKNVQISVPAAVTINQDVPLTCLYDLDHGESLYTVKWYLESEEFYRYIPKEIPPIQTFTTMGVDVDISKSDEHKVMLRSVRHEQTGVYKCEVSADAPEFETDVVSAQMTVVEFTTNTPLIELAKTRYEVGERIRANCSFGPTRPAANITWFINNLQVKEQYVNEFPVFEDGTRGNWVKSSLEMDTDANSFRGGRLKLKCIASVYSIYKRASEMQIEEEKPRSASVLGSKDSSSSSSSSSSGNQVGLNTSGHSKSPSVSDTSLRSSSHTLKASVQLLHSVNILFLVLPFLLLQLPSPLLYLVGQHQLLPPPLPRSSR